MTKVPSAAEAGQVEVLDQRPEHSRGYPPDDASTLVVHKAAGPDTPAPSLIPQGTEPLPDRSV